jgi:alkanesulfonate monooxygenase SsuD/methylene tetrahydromethanopterin reductase-like flavin-dependent oxidoreductase (luciferase family)
MVLFGAYADCDGATFNELREMALEAERLEFDSFWLIDHLHGFPLPDRQPLLESWTTLSALSTLTKRIRLGILVMNVQNRLPSLVAKMGSTLDVITNGRLEMGLGAGGTGRSSLHERWGYTPEYLAYGTPFSESAAIRIQKLDEAAHIIRLMWTHERATFSGRHFSVKNAICNPRPHQVPHPRIWIAGQGRYLLKVAARRADAVNLHWNLTPEHYRRKLSQLEKNCRELDTDYTHIVKSLTAGALIAENDAELRHLKEELINRYRLSEGFVPYPLQESGIIGSPRQCESTINQFVESGVQYFVLMFTGIDQMKFFATTVLSDF